MMDEKVKIHDDYIKHLGGRPPMVSGMGIITGNGGACGADAGSGEVNVGR